MIGEILGNYRIVSLIGEGGMGVVYLAEHMLIGRKAAIKLLRHDVSRELVNRFFNEARAAAMLRHPGLVEVFDFGHSTKGSAYIVMEFLEGESLAQRLAREGRLAVPIASMITRQVASALQVAHRDGIIHRDLKPENVFLVADNDAPEGIRTKVLDFGIAKLSNDALQHSVKTNSGALFGTPCYMSPEQCKNARTVDGRADVYSLGCMFYEMLVGVPPFGYESWAELVSAHLHEAPPRPSELAPSLPADVEAVVLKALEKRVEDRYPTMQALAQAVETVWRAHATDKLTASLTPPSGIRAAAPTREATKRVVAGGKDPTLAAGGKDPTLAAGGKDPTLAATSKDSMRAAGSQADVGTAPIRRGGSRRAIVLAAGAASVAVIGVVAWGLAGRASARSEPAEPAFIVVDERGAQAPGSAAVGPQPGSAAVVQAALDAGAGSSTAPADATVRAETGPHGARSTEPDTKQLTRAFERQTGAVAGCFRQHPATTNDAIMVRFQIDVTGSVVSAEVLPEPVARTPLGSCLVDVARATAFGPQPKRVTFRVPIHASVTGGD